MGQDFNKILQNSYTIGKHKFTASVEKLAGSLKMPSRWKDKDLDEIIEESKSKYFIKKWKLL